MVTNSSTEFWHGPITVYMGTAGSTATTPVGLVREEEAVEFAFSSPDGKALRAQGYKLPLEYLIPNRELMITVPGLQMNETLVSRALGLTASSGVITLSDSSDTTASPKYSFAFVGSDVNGSTWRMDIPYAAVTGDLTLNFTQTEYTNVSLTIHALDHTTAGSEPYMTAPDLSITVATGVATPTGTFHLVKGEGDAADAITSVGTTGYASGDIVVFKPYTTDYAITWTHGAAAIALTGSTNWTTFGGSLDDELILRYNGTYWVEVGRYDAP